MDRMEIIRIAGYTEDEKVEIARRHLISKALEGHGLRSAEWSIDDAALRQLIRVYTREAGVSSLERELNNLARKAVKEILTSDKKSVVVTMENIETYAGVPKYRYGEAEGEDQVGVVTGLAWTEVGGEVLHIEATLMQGRGNITLTGKLGEVMQESARAALSCVRTRAAVLGISPDFHKKYDLHLHVPEGAIPKDGPSAGIAISTAIVSVVTGVAIRCDVAMTGEITLRGKVLPVGGIKEKLLAAHRAGITTVVISKDNNKDLVELPEDVKAALSIITVDNVDEVWRIALEGPIVKADVPTTEVPIWGQQPPGEAPASNTGIE
jgi:ATP-dependent Lon protease